MKFRILLLSCLILLSTSLKSSSNQVPYLQPVVACAPNVVAVEPVPLVKHKPYLPRPCASPVPVRVAAPVVQHQVMVQNPTPVIQFERLLPQPVPVQVPAPVVVPAQVRPVTFLPQQPIIMEELVTPITELTVNEVPCPTTLVQSQVPLYRTIATKIIKNPSCCTTIAKRNAFIRNMELETVVKQNKLKKATVQIENLVATVINNVLSAARRKTTRVVRNDGEAFIAIQ